MQGDYGFFIFRRKRKKWREIEPKFFLFKAIVNKQGRVGDWLVLVRGWVRRGCIWDKRWAANKYDRFSF